MATTADIYEHYGVPRNLQKHMLRVASLAGSILQSWAGPTVDAEAIVQACLFHDIAKPMMFDLTKQAQFGMSPTDIMQLSKLQTWLKDTYGLKEHAATLSICKEIGCSDTVIRIVNNLEWDHIQDLAQKKDIESLLPIYCDMRIGPNGILPLDSRLRDLTKREGTSGFEQHGQKLEMLIAEETTRNIQAISPQEIDALLDLLLQKQLCETVCALFRKF
jgi:hypothetical protein